MRLLIFLLVFIIFIPFGYSSELKSVVGIFKQDQKISVTMMDKNGKVKTETKNNTINYSYSKEPKGAKKIPVSTNVKLKIEYIIKQQTVSACSTRTNTYIIYTNGLAFIIKKVNKETQTEIVNSELYGKKKNAKTF